MMSMLKNFAAALLVSYVLSIVFWLAFGVFNLPGFIFVSAAAALVGTLVGWLMRTSLIVTLLATAIVRIALFGFMTQSGG